LLAPTVDGLTLGGVKQGTNITIGADGTISASGLLQTNTPYSYNSYIWPVPDSLGFAPGTTGQVLTLTNKTTGAVGWTSTGGVNLVTGGTGITVTGTVTNPVVSLTATGAVTSPATTKTIGATALIPTLTFNSAGQILSTGQANPFSPFQTATLSAPSSLVLDFADNNLFWLWTIRINQTIGAPSNAISGQTGALLITQDPSSPYALTWDTVWKFASGQSGALTPVASAVDMFQFTVVAANYIVITNVIRNIG
jgi:hypothetical protein